MMHAFFRNRKWRAIIVISKPPFVEQKETNFLHEPDVQQNDQCTIIRQQLVETPTKYRTKARCTHSDEIRMGVYWFETEDPKAKVPSNPEFALVISRHRAPTDTKERTFAQGSMRKNKGDV